MASDYGGRSSGNRLRPSLKNVDSNFMKKGERDRREVRFEPPSSLKTMKNLRMQREEDLISFHNAQETISKALQEKFPGFEKEKFYQNLEESSETSDPESPGKKKSLSLRQEGEKETRKNEHKEETRKHENKEQALAKHLGSARESAGTSIGRQAENLEELKNSDRSELKRMPEASNSLEARRLELLTSLSGKSENLFNRERAAINYSTRTVPGKKKVYEFEEMDRSTSGRPASKPPSDFISKRETYEGESQLLLKEGEEMKGSTASHPSRGHDTASQRPERLPAVTPADGLENHQQEGSREGLSSSAHKVEASIGHSAKNSSIGHSAKNSEAPMHSKSKSSRGVEEVDIRGQELNTSKPFRSEKPPLSESNFVTTREKKQYLDPPQDGKEAAAHQQSKRRNTTNFSQAPLPESFDFLEELKKRELSQRRAIKVEERPQEKEAGRRSPALLSPSAEKRKQLEGLLEFKENINRLTPSKVRGGERKASFQPYSQRVGDDEEKPELSVKSLRIDGKGRQFNMADYARRLEDFRRPVQERKYDAEAEAEERKYHARAEEGAWEHHPAELDFKEGYLSFMPMPPNDGRTNAPQEEDLVRRIYEKNSHPSEEEIAYHKGSAKGEEIEYRHEEDDSSDQKRKLDSDIEIINNRVAQMKTSSEPEINSPTRRNDRRLSNISNVNKEKSDVGRVASSHKKESNTEAERERVQGSARSSRDMRGDAERATSMAHPDPQLEAKVGGANLASPLKDSQMIIRIKDSSEAWKRSIKYNFAIRGNLSHPGCNDRELKSECGGDSPKENFEDARSLRDFKAPVDPDDFSKLIAQEMSKHKARDKKRGEAKPDDGSSLRGSQASLKSGKSQKEDDRARNVELSPGASRVDERRDSQLSERFQAKPRESEAKSRGSEAGSREGEAKSRASEGKSRASEARSREGEAKSRASEARSKGSELSHGGFAQLKANQEHPSQISATSGSRKSSKHVDQESEKNSLLNHEKGEMRRSSLQNSKAFDSKDENKSHRSFHTTDDPELLLKHKGASHPGSELGESQRLLHEKPEDPGLNYEFLEASRELRHEKNQLLEEIRKPAEGHMELSQSRRSQNEEEQEFNLRNSSRELGVNRSNSRRSSFRSEKNGGEVVRGDSEHLIDEYQNKLKNELIMDIELLEKRTQETEASKCLKRFADELFKHQFWETVDAFKELGLHYLQTKEAQKLYSSKLKLKGVEALKENFLRNMAKRKREQTLADFLEQRKRRQKEEVFSEFASICSAHRSWLESVRAQLRNLKLGNAFKAWALEVYYKKSKAEMKLYRTGKLFDKFREQAFRETSKKNNKAFSQFYVSVIRKHFRLWKGKIKEKLKVEAKFKQAKKAVTLLRKRFYLALLKKGLKRGRTKINIDDYDDYIPITVSIKDKVSKTTRKETSDTFISTTKAIDIKVLKGPGKK